VNVFRAQSEESEERDLAGDMQLEWERTPLACGVRRRAEHIPPTLFLSPFDAEKVRSWKSLPGRQRRPAWRGRSPLACIVRLSRPNRQTRDKMSAPHSQTRFWQKV